MIRKLKWEIIAIIMLISAALLSLGVALIYHTTRINLEQDSISVMRSVSLTPVRVSLPEQDENDMRIPVFTLHKEADGTFSAYGGQDYDLSDQTFLRDLYDEVQSQDQETGVIPAYQLRFLKISDPDAYIVFSDMSFESSTLSHLLRTALLVAGIGLGVILLLSILLANVAVRPVERAWQGQKQFVADASHELKTPLTVILTNAEMLQSGGFNKQDRSELTANILEMSRQMKGLVEKLLALARADRAPEKGEQVYLDLSQVMENCVMLFEPLCYESGHRIETDIQKGVIVRGSREELSRLGTIFLDNAVKYADPGSPILLTLHSEGKGRLPGQLFHRQWALLSVKNTCAGADPSMEKNVFKRFYRGDQTHSMNQSYGLGLSIAQAIVTRHRGFIRCYVENGKVTMLVRLRCHHQSL